MGHGGVRCCRREFWVLVGYAVVGLVCVVVSCCGGLVWCGGGSGLRLLMPDGCIFSIGMVWACDFLGMGVWFLVVVDGCGLVVVVVDFSWWAMVAVGCCVVVDVGYNVVVKRETFLW